MDSEAIMFIMDLNPTIFPSMFFLPALCFYLPRVPALWSTEHLHQDADGYPIQ